ncbi:MAG TPA: hypothetical protein VHC46_09615 [Thermodesulfobacteriota bacterium]|nr:hypothetical protein [Candidatus Paceibacterota bacterium]HVY55999.1 hypothetical protein [Thermodesulfobacteriota bacterium]
MKKIFFTAMVLIFAAPALAAAAVVSLDAPKTATVGEEILVRVLLDTEKDKANAVSGSISLDQGALSVLRTYEAQSAITVWIEKPTIVPATPARPTFIEFSGITPGGFQGRFELFSFIARSSKAGIAMLRPSDFIVLKNNGEGTAVATRSTPASVTIQAGSSTATVLIADAVSPEGFAPVVASSKDLFDGKAFVSFSATDKNTGIDHYEYAVSRFFAPKPSAYMVVTSPLELDQASYSKRIFIKAVDKAGNVRISSTFGPRYWESLSLWGILILILALCALTYIRRRSSSVRR